MSAPVLTTERLELWLPRYDDARALHRIVGDAETARYLSPAGEWPDYYGRFHRNAGAWFLHGYGNFIVRPRGNDEIIGILGVFHSNRGLGDDFDELPEAGWILARKHVGKGLAHEGMAAAIAWFEAEHGAQRIVAMVVPGNAPSIHLAEKLGFTPLRDAEFAGESVMLFERLPGALQRP